MKVYTKTGDDGTTSLIGGCRVKKSDIHLEIYGTLDELSSHIGLLKVECANDAIIAELNKIQEILTGINICFACPDESYSEKYKFDTANTVWIEKAIDSYSAVLPPVSKFLIPGTNKCNALANICRTVCRRAERCVYRMELNENQAASAVFINRLSDFFFVLGRIFEQK